MYTAIYRDFRPNRFEAMIGQDHIVKILKNQIAKGQTGHAYLFCGTRGTGKTTTARILAKALNCTSDAERPCCECENCRAIKGGSFIDVVEIDAASNNSVDDIRNLCESVNYPPIMGKCKIYIIDEVHMLSGSAFNALLKTLEEPPDHVVFILATTEVHKLPATILSRCMRLDFRRVSEQKIIENMRMICEARGISYEEAALSLIAANADGSVRDSLSILEQCISGANSLTLEDTAEILGAVGEDKLIQLTDMIMNADISSALLLLNDFISAGRDVKQIMRDWLSHFRNLLIAKFVKSPNDMLSMSEENVRRIGNQSSAIAKELLNAGITELTKTIADARWSAQPRALLEMCAVKLATLQANGGVETGFNFENSEPFRTQQKITSANSVRTSSKPQNQILRNVEAKPQNELVEEIATEPDFEEIADVFSDDESLNVQSDFSETRSEEPAKSNTEIRAAELDNKFDDYKLKQNKSQESSDLSILWRSVIQRLLMQKPNLMRLESRTKLDDVKDNQFFVSCADENTETMMLRYGGNRLIEEFMSESLGKTMKMVIHRVESGGDADRNAEAAHAGEQLSRILDFDVNIK